MKRIVIVGTQGVPASYGGFESLVENLIKYRSTPDILYTVFCSSKDLKQDISTYNGANLKYVNLSANGIQSIFYDIISLIRSIKLFDTILVLGVSGCIFLPIFRLLSQKRLIINIDGLEHKRAKWSPLAKKFLLISEKMAIKYADVIISDNKGIQDYVTKQYQVKSELIAYGGDQVKRNVNQDFENQILSNFNLIPETYSLAICRIEPENNCHIILKAFQNTNHKILFIGNWNKSEYGRQLKNIYQQEPNIIISDPIYDLDKLYVLRKHAKSYIHGHSAGGTNPSLVEAMFFGNPILTYDVIYNRETTENRAYYFQNSESLKLLLQKNDLDGSRLKDIAEKKYTWHVITKQYESLY